jgi:hypothetical protein
MIRFSLSSVFPGQDPGNAWDYWWRLSSSWNIDDIPGAGQGGSSSSYALAFGPYTLTSPTPLVTEDFTGPAGVTTEDVTLNAPWNTIKDVEIKQLDSFSFGANGFVDTWIAAAADNNRHDVTVTGAKRGAIDLGSGNDDVLVYYRSNEYTWSNDFHISVGNGSDLIRVQPESFDHIASTPTPAGWKFNTVPDLTTASISLGSGNDTVETRECSATVAAGSGTTFISVVDGHNMLTLGSGTDMVLISTDRPELEGWAVATDRSSTTVLLGSGHADIWIDDTMQFMTPLTTIVVSHGRTGAQAAGAPTDAADAIRYGHGSPNEFVGGDWSALTFDLVGFSPGSSATLTPANGHTELDVQDAAGGPADALNLYGIPPSSIAALHLNFL